MKALIVLLLLPLCGCVTQAKYDESQKKVEALNKQLNDMSDALLQANGKISELSAHKYSAFQMGARTWRLDGTTGKSCLMLASDADWKNKDMKAQGCPCDDLIANYPNANAEYVSKICGFY